MAGIFRSIFRGRVAAASFMSQYVQWEGQISACTRLRYDLALSPDALALSAACTLTAITSFSYPSRMIRSLHN